MSQEDLINLVNGINAKQVNIYTGDYASANYYEAKEKDNTTVSENDVKRAVLRLMEEKDDNGNYIVCEQAQFYAIKAVLTSPRYGFPTKPSDFGKVIHNLELDNLRVRYDYDSIRKIHLHQLPPNVDLWHQYKNTSDDYSRKQVIPALKLKELLEEERR